MRKVLVINLGWEQYPLIKKLAAKQDVSLYGIHYNEAAVLPEVFQKIKIFDLRDLASILEYARKLEPDAVISDECDYSLFAQALIADNLDLPGPSLRAAQLSNNKYFQREVSRFSDILVPNYKLCHTLEDLVEFVEHQNYPIILKPVDNRGSIGVVKVSTDSELLEAFLNALVNSHSRCVLAEEFIHGQQITIDGYSFPGSGCKSLALGSKLMIDDAYKQVAVGISYPGDLKHEVFIQALAINETVNNKLGYDFGMTHSEYMVTDNGIYLIESSNRGGGVFTSEIILPEVSGIDVVDQYISDVLSEDKFLYMHPKKNPVVLRFFSFDAGVVKKISNWSKVSNDSRVLQSELFIKPGEAICEVSSDANRHGFFIMQGTPAEAEMLLKEVAVEYSA